ncbi:MAG TPA: DUF1501 domain-containing protein [Thermoleophilaceae bacterium]
MRNAHHACDDFHTTSETRRRSFLDTPLSRRQILGRGLGAGLAIYAAKAMPLVRILEAAEAQAQVAPAAPILVSVFLPGGCDLLDTIVPVSQYGRYADLRSGLKIEQPAALGSTGLGVNPHLADGLNGGIKGLFEAGKIGLLPGIDYANPDLSHFHSRHFWETGLITPVSATGWLGRWLDHVGSKENPLQGVSMDAALSPVLRSSSSPVAAVSSPDDAQFWIPGLWGDAFDRTMEAWTKIAASRPHPPGPAAAYAGARQSKSVADILKPFVKDDDGNDPLAGPIAYPEGDLADRLKSLAGLLSLPLGIRAVTVDSDGDFDTHDNQALDLGDGLTKVSGSLAAFQADLEARGIADRVLTLVWSEFGRRPQQNESGGTDHGAGGVAWVQGTRVQSGVLTDYPDLNRLDSEDNLAVTVDFRRVYASVLEQWLGTDASAVIPNAGALGRLQLVA